MSNNDQKQVHLNNEADITTEYTHTQAPVNTYYNNTSEKKQPKRETNTNKSEDEAMTTKVEDVCSLCLRRTKDIVTLDYYCECVQLVCRTCYSELDKNKAACSIHFTYGLKIHNLY